MTVSDNKALIAQFYDEVWANGNLGFSHLVFHDDYVRHDLRPSPAEPGAAGQAKIAGDFRAAFPDLRWRVDFILGEDDMVAARWTASGTNTGAWGAVPATGKPVEFTGVNIFRVRDGKVAEIWNYRDDLGLMTQLGVPIMTGATGVAGD